MLILDRSEEVALLERAINGLGSGLTILEAGCGRKWPLRLAIDYRLIGVDEDENALRARIEDIGDLQEYQVNKLGDAQFPPRSFDVIYCSYVLEHVVGVQKVLENFATWIRPGGLIILRVPDGRSVYGFLAKHTPHWIHIAAKRHVSRLKNAGKPGHGPYPVVYEPAMSYAGISQYCESHGFSMSATASAVYLTWRWWIKPLAVAASWLSFGQLSWKHANLAFIIRA